MPRADWLSTICIVGMLVIVAVVAVDRNRLKHRLDNSEGRFARLSLDVDALRGRVTELTSYLNRPASWDIDAQPPAELTDARLADRQYHEPPAPAPASETRQGRSGAGRHAAGGPGASGPVIGPQRSAR